MSNQNRSEVRFVDRTMASVRKIAGSALASHLKLSALQAISAKLGAAAQKCKARYDRAKQTRNERQQRALEKKRDLLDRAIRYVASCAVHMVQRKPRCGFGFEPVYFARPRWD